MNHRKIRDEEIIERYILNMLSPQEKERFEIHYLDCDRCFEAVKEMERVILGVRDAARRGTLLAGEEQREKLFGFTDKLRSLFPSFVPSPAVVAIAAVFVLALLYPAWRGIVHVPRLEHELAKLRGPRIAPGSYHLTQSPPEQDGPVAGFPPSAPEPEAIPGERGRRDEYFGRSGRSEASAPAPTESVLEETIGEIPLEARGKKGNFSGQVAAVDDTATQISTQYKKDEIEDILARTSDLQAPAIEGAGEERMGKATAAPEVTERSRWKDISLPVPDKQKAKVDIIPGKAPDELKESAIDIPGGGETQHRRDSFSFDAESDGFAVRIGMSADERAERSEPERMSISAFTGRSASGMGRGEEAPCSAPPADISPKMEARGDGVTNDHIEYIRLDNPDEVFVLSVEIPEGASPNSTCDVEVVGEDGNVMWRVDDMRMPEAGGELTFSFRGSLFGSGVYFLKVYAVDPVDGSVEQEHGYTFHVLFSEPR